MWQTSKFNGLELNDKEAHVWLVNIDQQTHKINNYWRVLNSEEQQKANLFKFEKDRSCYIIARAVLRILLGNYLAKPPESIVFKTIKNGKPFVYNSKDVQFNISHSKNCILLGFVKKHQIGIDVEYTKRPIEVELIAKSFFAEEEVNNLLALDKCYQNEAFYNCWTRKEAFIKALGDGLAFPLNEFVVSLDCEKTAILLNTKWNEKEKENWTLEAIQVQKNYTAAMAIKGKIVAIECYKYA